MIRPQGFGHPSQNRLASFTFSKRKWGLMFKERKAELEISAADFCGDE